MNIRRTIVMLLIAAATVIPMFAAQAAPETKENKSQKPHKRIHKAKGKESKAQKSDSSDATQEFLDGDRDSIICDPVPTPKYPTTRQRRRLNFHSQGAGFPDGAVGDFWPRQKIK